MWAVTVHDVGPGRPPLDPAASSTRQSGRRLERSPARGRGRLARGRRGRRLGPTARPTLPTHPGGLERVDPRTHRRTAVVADVDAQSIAASRRFGLDARRRDRDPARRRAGASCNRVRHISPDARLRRASSRSSRTPTARGSSASPTACSTGSRTGASPSGSASVELGGAIARSALGRVGDRAGGRRPLRARARGSPTSGKMTGRVGDRQRTCPRRSCRSASRCG